MKIVLIALIAFAAAVGQEFEVASIKPASASAERSSSRLTPGLLVGENLSLRKCIALAYDISEDRDGAIAAPDWLESLRFDILAKFPPSTEEKQVREMFRNLLADRFRLKVHRESKEVTVYALVAAKNGPTLVESKPGTPGNVSQGPGRLTGHSAPVKALADRLSGGLFQLGRPVVDRTGLTGLYDFALVWTPEAQDDAGPSLFTALQEQLGLKLESQKGSVEVLVVDSVEKRPTEN